MPGSEKNADRDYFVHASAIVDEGTVIGKGTSIWHFTHIMTGAVLGEGCNIGQNVFIGSGVILGNNVKVQNNVSIYTGVTCGDDVFLGPSMVFTNVINPRSAVNRKNQFVPTKVGRGVTIGANATVVCGNEIGDYGFVGAGAVVTKSILPYAMVLGNPARQKGWMSNCGYRLIFGQSGHATCPACNEVYLLQNNLVSKI